MRCVDCDHSRPCSDGTSCVARYFYLGGDKSPEFESCPKFAAVRSEDRHQAMLRRAGLPE